MKKLTFLILALCAVASANAATVWWGLTNWDLTLSTNASRVSPVGPVSAVGNAFVIGPQKTISPVGGLFTNTFAANNYRLDIVGTRYTNIIFAVPSDSNVYELTDLLISGGNTYHYTPGVSGLTSSNGTVSIYPSNGKGYVDLSVAALNTTNFAILSQSNQYAGSFVGDASGLTNFPPGIGGTNGGIVGGYVSSVNSRTGSVVVTSSDVVSALGYTPANDSAIGTAGRSNAAAFYLATNPSGYVNTNTMDARATNAADAEITRLAALNKNGWITNPALQGVVSVLSNAVANWRLSNIGPSLSLDEINGGASVQFDSSGTVTAGGFNSAGRATAAEFWGDGSHLTGVIATSTNATSFDTISDGTATNKNLHVGNGTTMDTTGTGKILATSATSAVNATNVWSKLSETNLPFSPQPASANLTNWSGTALFSTNGLATTVSLAPYVVSNDARSLTLSNATTRYANVADQSQNATFMIRATNGSPALQFHNNGDGRDASFLLNSSTQFLVSTTIKGPKFMGDDTANPAFVGDGSGLWNVQLDASKIASNTVPTARLGSGTANSSTYLRGDQTWATISGGGDVLQSGQNNFSGSNFFGGATTFGGAFSINNGTDTTTASNLVVNGWAEFDGAETNTSITGPGLIQIDANGKRSAATVGSGLTLSGGTLTANASGTGSSNITDAGYAVWINNAVVKTNFAVTNYATGNLVTISNGTYTSTGTQAGSLLSLGTTTNKVYTISGSNDVTIAAGGTNVISFTNTTAGLRIDAYARLNGDGAGLWNLILDAQNLASNTVPTGRLGSGTANSSSFLRGDQAWSRDGSGLFNVRIDAANVASNTLPIAVMPTRLQQFMTNYLDSAITNSAGQVIANALQGIIQTGATTNAGVVTLSTDGSSLWNVRVSAANIASNTIPIGVLSTPLQLLSTNYVGAGPTNSLGQVVANALQGIIQTGATTNNNVVTLAAGGSSNITDNGYAAVAQNFWVKTNLVITNTATATPNGWAKMQDDGLTSSNRANGGMVVITNATVSIYNLANPGKLTLGDTASNTVVSVNNTTAFTTNVNWWITNGTWLSTNTGAAGDFVQILRSNVWAGGLLSGYGIELSNRANIGGAIFTTNTVNVGTTLNVGGQTFHSNSIVVSAGGEFITGSVTNANSTQFATNAPVWCGSVRVVE